MLAFKKHQVKLFKLKTPAEVELTFQSSTFADVAADLPGATRVRGSGVRFVTPTIGDGLNTIKLLVFAAAGVKASTD